MLSSRRESLRDRAEAKKKRPLHACKSSPPPQASCRGGGGSPEHDEGAFRAGEHQAAAVQGVDLRISRAGREASLDGQINERGGWARAGVAVSGTVQQTAAGHASKPPPCQSSLRALCTASTAASCLTAAHLQAGEGLCSAKVLAPHDAAGCGGGGGGGRGSRRGGGSVWGPPGTAGPPLRQSRSSPLHTGCLTNHTSSAHTPPSAPLTSVVPEQQDAGRQQDGQH